MLSFKPAVHMAPMFARGLFSALSGQQASLDATQLLPSLALQDLQWWADNLEAANGSRIWDRQTSLCMASDASETAHAAYVMDHQHVIPDPEARATASWTYIQGYSRKDYDRMRSTPREFHSTLREVRTVHLALAALEGEHADWLQHSRVQWFSDSQAGVALLEGMKGRDDMLQEVCV